MCPLEQAIGVTALKALRDYLVKAYPIDKPVASRFDRAWKAEPVVPAKPELRTWHEFGLGRFYAKEYRKGGRRWWKVIDRVTDCVAVMSQPGSQKPERMELFLTWDEASVAIDKLCKYYV